MRPLIYLSVVLPATSLAAPVATAPKRVEVSIVGEPVAVREVEPAIRELLARLPIEVHWDRPSLLDPREVVTPRPAASPAVARVWVDVSSPTRVTLYVVDSRWERVLIRHVPLQGPLGEITREEIAHIVESAVEALLAGGQIGIAREEARRSLGLAPRPPLVARPEAPAAPAAADRVLLSLGYEARLWSTANGVALLHGPEAALVVRGRGAFLAASGAFWFPQTVDGPFLSLRMSGGAARISAGLETDGAWSLRVAGRLGLDLLRSEAVTTGLVLADPPATRVTPLVGGALSIRRSISETARAWAGVTVDVPIILRRYYAEFGESEVTLARPWPLQPGVVLGLDADLFRAANDSGRSR